ncbi:class I adenylate-forming enzyme family protein [Tractidigestivibacter sp.]|uniref:class I adenylate-forming enzyme family protein n=1 Tax=Tractidigestivibacter sp. TaxID=2847320 RepID=UPI002A91CC86|nr:class I adenylate-forming enzyme family protein [Tractidigestivibacter sp.]MDY5271558.1 class I adenylate-forming enzyme family protein [Tractidigestivibacter sp.]
MTIVDMLRKNAELYPSEVALVEVNPQRHENRHITWREYELVETTDDEPFRREMSWRVFDEKANRFANLLLSRGIRRDDRVAILLYNCIEWLPIYFGALKSGATVVPLNFRYSSDEIRYCVEKSDADILVFGPEFIGRVEGIVPQVQKGRLLFYVGDDCPTWAESYQELVGLCSSADPMVPLSADEDAAIYFSSGTTGFPKAILHHHESLTQAAVMEQKHHGQTHDDVFLCIPPLYHTGAIMHWMGSLAVGGRGILLRGVCPKTILETVSSERCTIVWLLVPWAQDILLAIEQGTVTLSDYRLDQWRLMHIGAQPVPKSLVRRWLKVFPNQRYDTNYGLSESCGPGCVHLGVENVGHVGAIGVPGYRWACKVVDETGAKVARGEVGELCVKGPGLMECYYKDPEATAEILVDGWLHTGDMARQDEDGFYWLVDRKKDVIVMGGENLYPVQIEDFLASNPAVQDVAVIGLPDERLGEIPAAIIELKPGHEGTAEKDIDEFCLALPRYKRPRKVIFAEVPRNPTGKIEKPLLRERYGAAHLVDRENRA